MPQRRSHVAPSASQSELAQALAHLRSEIDSPTTFSPEALAEAAATRPPSPDLDLRDIGFCTLDPAGSRDLDQAFHLERRGGGFRVRYAIADVPGFVRPGGAVDAEARLRGQTLYLADGPIPLHPPVLSEDRASLRAGVDRPALVWTFDLDADAEVTRFRLERALIRSRAQLDYACAQREVDRGGSEALLLLREIGTLRTALEHERGGASLNLPDAEVIQSPDGGYDLRLRQPSDVEEWNAQLSLMTGMAAAELMLGAGVGVLRTLPQPEPAAFERFRRQTEALGRPWVQGRYGDYLRGLDRSDPMALAVLEAAAALFRGAGYAAFDAEVPDHITQAAIGAPYAHATAPLRRLVDRWSLAICLAVSSGTAVPEWARETLSDLPGLMQRAGQRASRLNTDTVNRVEAALLAPRVGERFAATVLVRRGEDRAEIQLTDPVVTASAPLSADRGPGDVVGVTLLRADIERGEVEFG